MTSKLNPYWKTWKREILEKEKGLNTLNIYEMIFIKYATPTNTHICNVISNFHDLEEDHFIIVVVEYGILLELIKIRRKHRQIGVINTHWRKRIQHLGLMISWRRRSSTISLKLKLVYQFSLNLLTSGFNF